MPTGWNLTGATCAKNGGSATSYTGGNIVIAAGHSWVCTFNNSAPPFLTITKTPDTLGDTGYEIHPGGTASFTITVSNTGAGVATGVTLTDTLNAGGGLDEQSAQRVHHHRNRPELQHRDLESGR